MTTMTADVPVVSTATDPALAAQLAAKAVSGGQPKGESREPLAPLPPDGRVKLPCGYVDKEGDIHTEAVVSELNGADEEAMAKAATNAAFLNTILIRGVQTVGSHNALPELLENLLAPDRDALLIGIRRATYGDEIEYKVTCPECSHEHEAKLDLADIPSQEMSDPNDRFVTAQIKRGEAVLCVPNGKVQTDVLAAVGKSAAELNTIMLQGCVMSIAGEPVNSVADVRERLSARDRRTLLEALQAKVYGPRLGEVTRPCPSCAHTIALPLSLVDLFLV